MESPRDDPESVDAEHTHDLPPTRTDTATSATQPTLRSRKPTNNTRTDTADTGGLPRRQSFNLRRAVTTLLKPSRTLGKSPGVFQSIKSIILASWLNLLLVFIPISWAFNFADKEQHTLVFVFSFLAIIPLAKLLAFATDELSLRVGQTLAGLLNATLGNALIGSILSNLLLVLGMCFFAGGIKFSEQGFGASATQLNSSLLTISVITFLLPAAYRFSVASSSSGNQPSPDQGRKILDFSHGTAIIMLFIYGSYLFFQLYSHATMYGDQSGDITKSTQYGPTKNKYLKKLRHVNGVNGEKPMANGTATTSPTATTTQQTVSTTTDVEHGLPEQKEEEETLQLSLGVTLGLLIVVTVIVAVTAEWLVDSIDGLVESHPAINKEFVGIILLPIVGNAAEHVTAVSVSVKDKLTLSLGVAVGSSIQIALFVIPFIVTLGWILGKPLTMLFDPFESVAVFLSVLTVNYVVQDGKSNWLEGFILMALYLILALTFWYYPGASEEFTNFLPLCN
ncbi:Calcium/proton exchanger [Roridomyces roridus]|uniref:Calcium/proton exchanger n=1 Tax=Roridomyces roridus TaxID=1738132 RepID=A0AAD7BFD8_9AGAR|nr:Calcium/proton exchanger [Roridomyces roridus]